MNVADAYRRGRMRFMGVELLVEPGALVPRPETELLGRCALEVLAPWNAPRVIDMCCGAGNLACAIGHSMPLARIWGVDVSDACARLAHRNVTRLRLADRVQIVHGDLFAPLKGLGLEGTVHAIVCNPPYISERRLAGDRAHLLAHEPREAFDGGPYGLTVHQRVIREAASFLREGGALLFEIGAGQERQVRALFRRAPSYAGVRVWPDESGETRVMSAHHVQRAGGTDS